MPSFQFFIGGVDRTSYVKVNSVRWSKRLNGRSSLSCVLEDLGRGLSIQVGQPIVVTEDSVETRFGGHIQSLVERIHEGGTQYRQWTIEASDYNSVCDRRLVTASYTGQTLGAIVSAINASFLDGEGFSTSGVATGPTLTQEITFHYESVAEAFNQLSTTTGYLWRIDESKVIHFSQFAATPAPFGLTESSANWYDRSVKRDLKDYRNQQFARTEYNVFNEFSIGRTGDGSTRDFFTDGQIMNVAPTVTLNSIGQTVGRFGIDAVPGFDCYYDVNGVGVHWPSPLTPPGAGVSIVITALQEFTNVTFAQDEAAVAARAAVEGGSGKHQAIREERNVTTLAQLLGIAEGELRVKGIVPEIIDFSTQATGLAPGQRISINWPPHSINGSYLIEQVEYSWIAGPTPSQDIAEHRVTCSNNEAFGRPTDMFADIVRYARIGQGVPEAVEGGAGTDYGFGGLKNPDFELTPATQHWDLVGTVAEETVDVWQGKAIRLPGDGNTNYAYQHVPVKPGQAVRFACMAKNSTNTGIFVCQIHFKDAALASLGLEQSTLSNTGVYTAVEQISTAPANAAYAMVVPGYTNSAHTSGAFYADQCSFEIVTVVPAVASGVAGAGAAAETRTLTSGTKEYRFSLSWTSQTPSPKIASVRAYRIFSGATTLINTWPVSSSSGYSDWAAAPTSAESSTIRFYYVSADGVQSSSFTDVSVTVPAEAAKPLQGGAIVDLSVAEAALANAAVSTRVLANLSVDNNKLAALAVDAAKLANSAVTSTKIANLAVGSAAIAALAVGSAHIQDAAIQEAKIASLAVTNAKIGTAAVNEAKIADASVTNAKIANLSVAKLTSGTATFTGDVTFQNTGNFQMFNAGNLYVQPGTIFGTNAQFKSALNGWDVIAGLTPQLIGGSNSILSSEVYRFPFVVDTGLSFSASAGKIACYDRSGLFRGWIPVLP